MRHKIFIDAQLMGPICALMAGGEMMTFPLVVKSLVVELANIHYRVVHKIVCCMLLLLP